MMAVWGVSVPTARVLTASYLLAYSTVLALPRYGGNHIHRFIIGMAIDYVMNILTCTVLPWLHTGCVSYIYIVWWYIVSSGTPLSKDTLK